MKVRASLSVTSPTVASVRLVCRSTRSDPFKQRGLSRGSSGREMHAHVSGNRCVFRRGTRVSHRVGRRSMNQDQNGRNFRVIHDPTGWDLFIGM